MASGSGTEAKRAQQVAASIEDEVGAAHWPVGESLGSEAELMTRYGVSRGVLREAVRIVEHHQVAEMRRGPGGGLIVQAPETGPATTALIVYLEFVGTSVEQLMAARRILEPLVFGLAAQRRTTDDLLVLREKLARPDRAAEFDPASALDQGLHREVARIGRNVALELFVAVLIGLTNRFARVSSQGSAGWSPQRTGEIRAAHNALVEDIAAGDSSGAEHRVSEHLDAMNGWLTARSDNRPVTMTLRATSRDARPRGKRAEVLAGELIDDIVAAGWPVGAVFGSADELVERYGCGRAALREAVRLLELHNVARTRRGPGGGLIVTEPDPAAAITAGALYLEYSSVTSADLSVVRNAIEVACLDLVVRRAPHPETARTLRAAHQLTDASTNADLYATGNDLHQAIADLSGNPILALFLRIVTTLSARHNAAFIDEQMRTRTSAARTVGRSHQQILDAILARDGERARALMTEHLESTQPLWLL
jgi:DNA-binding FadR family transcriptional regulator